MATTQFEETFNNVFAFLSKTYWEEQDEMTEELQQSYNTVQNADQLFSVCPTGSLTLYDDEWYGVDTVHETLDELDEDVDNSTTYICNWKDDQGNLFYTLLFKEPVDNNIRSVTRMQPIINLNDTPEKLLDNGWHPLKAKLTDGTKMYVWESPEMSSYEFTEMYASWVPARTNQEDDDLSTSCDSE